MGKMNREKSVTNTPELEKITIRIITVCREGEERSVVAQKILKKNGAKVEFLNRGLIGLAEYFGINLAYSNEKAERTLNSTNETPNDFLRKTRADEGYYESILGKNALWLFFINKEEEKKSKEIFEKLKQLGINFKVFYSHSEDAAKRNAIKFFSENNGFEKNKN